jgi:hypothetical protein
MDSDKPPDEKLISPSDVWAELDASLRSRIVKLLIQIAYETVTARGTCELEETDNGSANHNGQGNETSH